MNQLAFVEEAGPVRVSILIESEAPFQDILGRSGPTALFAVEGPQSRFDGTVRSRLHVVIEGRIDTQPTLPDVPGRILRSQVLADPLDEIRGRGLLVIPSSDVHRFGHGGLISRFVDEAEFSHSAQDPVSA